MLKISVKGRCSARGVDGCWLKKLARKESEKPSLDLNAEFIGNDFVTCPPAGLTFHYLRFFSSLGDLNKCISTRVIVLVFLNE